MVLEISDHPVDDGKNEDTSRHPELRDPDESVHVCHVFSIRVLVELFDGIGLRKGCVTVRRGCFYHFELKTKSHGFCTDLTTWTPSRVETRADPPPR